MSVSERQVRLVRAAGRAGSFEDMPGDQEPRAAILRAVHSPGESYGKLDEGPGSHRIKRAHG
jgi:hypothetical protein